MCCCIRLLNKCGSVFIVLFLGDIIGMKFMILLWLYRKKLIVSGFVFVLSIEEVNFYFWCRVLYIICCIL